MNFTYRVELEVEITNVEAALLYKYLKTYPKGKFYLEDDQFAFHFKDFETFSEICVNLNTKTFDICIGALEDQEFNDDVENVLKEKLLKKLYDWAYKVLDEEDYIENMKSDFYHYELQLGIDLNKYFTLSKYFELRHLYYKAAIIRKPKKSIIEKVKNRIFGKN